MQELTLVYSAVQCTWDKQFNLGTELSASFAPWLPDQCVYPSCNALHCYVWDVLPWCALTEADIHFYGHERYRYTRYIYICISISICISRNRADQFYSCPSSPSTTWFNPRVHLLDFVAQSQQHMLRDQWAQGLEEWDSTKHTFSKTAGTEPNSFMVKIMSKGLFDIFGSPNCEACTQF